MTTLKQAGFRLAPPEGSYYVMADYRGFQEASPGCPPGLDDVAFARWLAVDRKVATVPGSAFYHDPADGRHLVRFAFPKQITTLEEVGRRLRGFDP